MYKEKLVQLVSEVPLVKLEPLEQVVQLEGLEQQDQLDPEVTWVSLAQLVQLEQLVLLDHQALAYLEELRVLMFLVPAIISTVMNHARSQAPALLLFTQHIVFAM